MARRGGSGAKRDTFAISTVPVRSRIVLPSRRLASYFEPPLRAREDRRSFHPLGIFRPVGVLGYRSSRRVVERSKDFSAPTVLGFDVPKRVALCVRRKQRRQVLHALNRTRAGRGGRKRRNEWSDISCR